MMATDEIEEHYKLLSVPIAGIIINPRRDLGLYAERRSELAQSGKPVRLAAVAPDLRVNVMRLCIASFRGKTVREFPSNG
jgi:hypothetical protein